ncbi:phosphatidylinositol 4-phosphate 3-kinase C2 domain-containing subunit alpha isoform X1 [Phyllopteryx taeniolatus]|uniref:phosphatidylinositol 4-phosphate 3-kinase C2 domain-containing subunit alpha isoform X1 n=1 Tax=Phyllopteryx taeniolatus TaxID=161469 RepID=UPI002AD3EB05|nr:phosphatidylinositol 4-phosphate 3-kinase C2 domain-containing subunit alpha isoform X1 [Phyllopteryx taeniolatus]XP_061630060.1 phosphatidylinositol 4-phosphate 3-kinase C2 domain-containing subunit alpha isoform X1 [Phyllopteryx taeniolatus]XP_061630061.1 phosphatidylinositol 4-phosphate 3-kinase C2 domain-containing subunit alpha isoform X1 [Phyllopteryx taeniolatus]XP_061630062.1 phosphatidylinositol 4-phosphate 3-kinase C2 domain-containing subunit alpha isoform X1 [Phyllopteryx taeniola
MAQISRGNGFKLDVPQPKGLVGKEEALRMEEEALAKLQRDKKQTFSSSPTAAPSPKSKKPKSTTIASAFAAPQRLPASKRPEKDLIVFPETKKQPEANKFRDIDVDKLTNEELEKLLLDENFGANSKVSRPSSLLGFNLSASYPGGHTCSSSPFQGSQWTPILSTPSNSTVSTPTHQPAPLFPSAPFPKPGAFQNGFTPAMSPFMALPAQQTSFLAFTPIQPATTATTMVFPPPPAVDPEMAKLFDKIASTSEYLKNGKSACSDLDSAPVCSASLAPNPAAQQPAATESTCISRFDWLDLDPLTKRKADNEEAGTSPGDDPEVAQGLSGGDPWDAVLETEGKSSSSSTPLEGKASGSARSQPRRASTGAAVTRSHSLNIPGTSSPHKANSQPMQDKGKGKGLVKNDALEQEDAQNLEVVAFCKDVASLRSKFPHGDTATNPGYIRSPVIAQRDAGGDTSCSVKVSIEISDSQQPVTFTCDVNSPVELLISQTLCWVHDDLDQVDFSSYLLKVCGREEVLQNKHSLGSHEYVQNCRKWENEITLQLLSHSTMRRDLARTVDDDNVSINLEKHLSYVERPFKETATRQGLIDYLEGYHNQVNICLQNESTQYKTVDRVMQTVKNFCCALDEVETQAIAEGVKRLRHSVNLPRTRSPKMGSPSPGKAANGHASPVDESMALLTQAVYSLAKLYLRSFCAPSTSVSSPLLNGETAEDQRSSKEASGTTDHLQFTLYALHGIPANWVSSYEKYFLVCSLTHNGKNLFKPVQSKRVGTYKSYFYHLKWDELINFPIAVAVLPLESVLGLTLYGVLNQNAGGSPDSNKQRKAPEMLGKVSMPLFDFRRVLARGTRLLCLWSSVQGAAAGSAGGRKKMPAERIVLQVDFPNSVLDVLYVGPQEAPSPEPNPTEELDPDLRRKLQKICSRASNFGLKRADHQLLWDYRLHCRWDHPSSLPKVLASAPSWDWASMAHIHSLLHHWPPLLPVTALELLDSKFADTEVRRVAVSWVEESTDDELADYLPQLVQALKFDCHLKSALVMLLLSRALGNINIAHYLYWLLKDAVQDAVWGRRYERVLGALLCLCGTKLRAELEKQTQFVTLLGAVAERVRQAGGSTRPVALLEGLESVQNFFQRSYCRLPLFPSLVAKELNIKACSFFNSNAVPLKLALVNADPLGEEINVMFKVGEDLRQDMLALQMIRIMDRIWLQEGLDLRIVNFKCISTGKDKGMVELVPSSDTLRKIQVEYGVTGSFKDKPLAEWLRKYNPAEDEYEKASENFIYSCAGCCVATYVLGICDRHNDNIMLRSTGHMFHIDFGKFLGHAQMFGSFKRDRAPFVLTSDMAYVINGGERPTSRFQLFVDLCCQAYNLIRKHSGLFLNLLSLMTSSGLPELTGSQDLKYVYDALQPHNTDAEATIFFTRLIESSLGSVATKFNFFIHNLAQLRFSGLPANDEPILSFSPKTYTMKQEGRILHAAIFSFQKRYNPDKHYTYVVRLLREGQNEPQFVFRTFDEFQELHNKLTIIFPLWKLPSFPSKMVLGRTHIKEVAAKRKLELNSYIHNLMRSSAEVTQCDLIYTFFHPVARDDKTEGLEATSRVPDPPLSPTSGRVEGEVKLSISYRNSTLFIMVMHIRDLVSEEGTDPNPYVKTYLLPDPHKTSKRKTKISRKTRNPTFNEMLVYSGYSKETLGLREVQLSVLSAESLRENYFLGGITLRLKDFDLGKETVKWYKLAAVPYF